MMLKNRRRQNGLEDGWKPPESWPYDAGSGVVVGMGGPTPPPPASAGLALSRPSPAAKPHVVVQSIPPEEEEVSSPGLPQAPASVETFNRWLAPRTDRTARQRFVQKWHQPQDDSNFVPWTVGAGMLVVLTAGLYLVSVPVIQYAILVLAMVYIVPAIFLFGHIKTKLGVGEAVVGESWSWSWLDRRYSGTPPTWLLAVLSPVLAVLFVIFVLVSAGVYCLERPARRRTGRPDEG